MDKKPVKVVPISNKFLLICAKTDNSRQFLVHPKNVRPFPNCPPKMGVFLPPPVFLTMVGGGLRRRMIDWANPAHFAKFWAEAARILSPAVKWASTDHRFTKLENWGHRMLVIEWMDGFV